MKWLNGSAPDCKTCSPGFQSGISPTCRDMSFLVGLASEGWQRQRKYQNTKKIIRKKNKKKH